MIALKDGRAELYQWDTGRILNVPTECSQVHFSNKIFGRSIDVDVVNGGALIPDILLQSDKELAVWAFVGTAENGYTKISKNFKVNKRNKPADYVFTPTEQKTLEEIIEKANKTILDAERLAESASKSAKEAEESSGAAAASAQAAQSSADAASECAGSAGDSAGAAATSAQAAQSSADSAANAASSAEASAEAAETSAQAAAASAASIGDAEIAAERSAEAAATSAQAAQTSATAAAQSADSAERAASSAASAASDAVAAVAADVLTMGKSLGEDHAIYQVLTDSDAMSLLDGNGNQMEGRVLFADAEDVADIRKAVAALETCIQEMFPLALNTRVAQLEKGAAEAYKSISELQEHALLDSTI